MTNKYSEKPKVIEAIQYKGYESLQLIKEFMGCDFEMVLFRPFSERLIISEKEREVKVGDYIIKDNAKRFYSLSLELFEHKYEKSD